jgi:hypothetical protein
MAPHDISDPATGFVDAPEDESEAALIAFLKRAQSHGRYWYLASPYTRQRNRESAFRAACLASAWLLERRVRVFSPIAHSHAIAGATDLDPLNQQFWMAAMRPLMTAACGLILLPLRGWRRSEGIGQELVIFRRAIKPAVRMPDDVTAAIEQAVKPRQVEKLGDLPRGLCKLGCGLDRQHKTPEQCVKALKRSLIMQQRAALDLRAELKRLRAEKQ